MESLLQLCEAILGYPNQCWYTNVQDHRSTVLFITHLPGFPPVDQICLYAIFRSLTCSGVKKHPVGILLKRHQALHNQRAPLSSWRGLPCKGNVKDEKRIEKTLTQSKQKKRAQQGAEPCLLSNVMPGQLA